MAKKTLNHTIHRTPKHSAPPSPRPEARQRLEDGGAAGGAVQFNALKPMNALETDPNA